MAPPARPWHLSGAGLGALFTGRHRCGDGLGEGGRGQPGLEDRQETGSNRDTEILICRSLWGWGYLLFS